MVYFKTKNTNLGKFGRVLQWKMLVYFMANLSILRSFGIVYGHLVHFMANWYIYSHFGMLYQEKSGNPGTYFLKSISKSEFADSKVNVCAYMYATQKF
jgi:hypothetical protein